MSPTQLALARLAHAQRLGAATQTTLRDASTIQIRGYLPQHAAAFDCPLITQITQDVWLGGSQPRTRLPRFVSHVVRVGGDAYHADHDVDSTLVVRMRDSEDEQLVQAKAAAAWVAEARKSGSVLVHCQAGLNRAALVVALVLMGDGGSATKAVNRLRGARSTAVLCNPRFEAWLRLQDQTANQSTKGHA